MIRFGMIIEPGACDKLGLRDFNGKYIQMEREFGTGSPVCSTLKFTVEGKDLEQCLSKILLAFGQRITPDLIAQSKFVDQAVAVKHWRQEAEYHQAQAKKAEAALEELREKIRDLPEILWGEEKPYDDPDDYPEHDEEDTDET